MSFVAPLVSAIGKYSTAQLVAIPVVVGGGALLANYVGKKAFNTVMTTDPRRKVRQSQVERATQFNQRLKGGFYRRQGFRRDRTYQELEKQELARKLKKHGIADESDRIYAEEALRAAKLRRMEEARDQALQRQMDLATRRRMYNAVYNSKFNPANWFKKNKNRSRDDYNDKHEFKNKRHHDPFTMGGMGHHSPGYGGAGHGGGGHGGGGGGGAPRGRGHRGKRR